MKNSTNTLNVIIAGSRNFDDYDLLCRECDAVLNGKAAKHHITIFSGCANGADTLGERYAKEHGYDIRRFPANWKEHGKAAGPIRNARMVADANILIAFWDGSSRGTRHIIVTAESRGLEVNVVVYNK